MENRLLSEVEKTEVTFSTATNPEKSVISPFVKNQKILGKDGTLYSLKDLRTNYNIKTPRHKDRKTFAVVVIHKAKSGKVVSRTTLSDTRINILNHAVKNKSKTVDVAY